MALPHRTAEIARALAFAQRQLGVPYQWGGTSRATGFDCSGLVYAAYRAAGYQGIGRTTYDQIKQGVAVSARHLKPGDIVFPEPGHEGLYLGNGMVLEAPHTGARVQVIPLKDFGFMTARRLIGGGGGIIPPRAIAGQAGGLPIASPNPQDRQPHLQAALAALGNVRPVKITPPKISLKSPSQALGEILGQPPQASFLDQPVQPPAVPALSAEGQTVGEIGTGLDAARRRLLGSLGSPP